MVYIRNYEGKVKWFNVEKGYGFIYCNEVKKDIFFHVEQVQMEGMVILTPSTSVEFQLIEDTTGLKAINVYLNKKEGTR